MGTSALIAWALREKRRERERYKPPITAITNRQHTPFSASLSSVLSSPLTCRRLVSGAVCLVHMSDLGDKWVVGVRIRQHGADRE